MNVIIAGGRDFTNYNVLCSCCDYVLEDVKHLDITIVEGEAKGADILGRKYALERNYKLDAKPANWDKFGKSAGYVRNLEMAKVASVCICFWDQQSKGTKHMIDIAKERQLQLFVFDYQGNYIEV